MAAIFNKIGQLGLGVALVGGVVNSALYNGMCKTLSLAGYFMYMIFVLSVNIYIWFLFSQQLMVVIVL